MEIASEADEHSQATAKTLGNARSDHPSSPHDHTGQQTCGQNPATPFPRGPGNPAEKHPGEIHLCLSIQTMTVLNPRSPTGIPLNSLHSAHQEPQPSPMAK